MATITLQGDSSGSVNLTVPASAGTNTITFPAATGTVLLGGASPAAGSAGQLAVYTGAAAIGGSFTPTLGVVGTTAGTLTLAGSTSGSTTLAASAVAGTTTATLPARTGNLMMDGPAFYVTQNTGQTISNSTTTKITFNTVVFDTGSCWNSASNRFVPNVSGYYQINSYAAVASNWNVAGFSNNYLYKNGTLIAASASQAVNANGNYLGGTISVLLYMNGSTDYIELYNLHNGAVTDPAPLVNDSAFVYMSGNLVRGA